MTQQLSLGYHSLTAIKGNVHGRLNGSWKICSLAANGQSFLVIDGYLLNSYLFLCLDCKTAAEKSLKESCLRDRSAAS